MAQEAAHGNWEYLYEGTGMAYMTCQSCTAGATSLTVTGGDVGIIGQGRLLIDSNPTATGTGLSASVSTIPLPVISTPGTNFSPAKFFISSNSVMISSGLVIPGAQNVTISTSVPAGVSTSTSGLGASGIACVSAPLVGVPVPDFESVPYTVVDGTTLSLTFNKAHSAGFVIAIGPGCGQGIEETANTPEFGLKQVYPVMGYVDATHLAYSGGPSGAPLGANGVTHYNSADASTTGFAIYPAVEVLGINGQTVTVAPNSLNFANDALIQTHGLFPQFSGWRVDTFQSTPGDLPSHLFDAVCEGYECRLALTTGIRAMNTNADSVYSTAAKPLSAFASEGSWQYGLWMHHMPGTAIFGLDDKNACPVGSGCSVPLFYATQGGGGITYTWDGGGQTSMNFGTTSVTFAGSSFQGGNVSLNGNTTISGTLNSVTGGAPYATFASYNAMGFELGKAPFGATNLSTYRRMGFVNTYIDGADTFNVMDFEIGTWDADGNPNLRDSQAVFHAKAYSGYDYSLSLLNGKTDCARNSLCLGSTSKADSDGLYTSGLLGLTGTSVPAAGTTCPTNGFIGFNSDGNLIVCSNGTVKTINTN